MDQIPSATQVRRKCDTSATQVRRKCDTWDSLETHLGLTWDSLGTHLRLTWGSLGTHLGLTWISRPPEEDWGGQERAKYQSNFQSRSILTDCIDSGSLKICKSAVFVWEGVQHAGFQKCVNIDNKSDHKGPEGTRKLQIK